MLSRIKLTVLRPCEQKNHEQFVSSVLDSSTLSFLRFCARGSCSPRSFSSPGMHDIHLRGHCSAGIRPGSCSVVATDEDTQKAPRWVFLVAFACDYQNGTLALTCLFRNSPKTNLSLQGPQTENRLAPICLYWQSLRLGADPFSMQEAVEIKLILQGECHGL